MNDVYIENHISQIQACYCIIAILTMDMTEHTINQGFARNTDIRNNQRQGIGKSREGERNDPDFAYL